MKSPYSSYWQKIASTPPPTYGTILAFLLVGRNRTETPSGSMLNFSDW